MFEGRPDRDFLHVEDSWWGRIHAASLRNGDHGECSGYALRERACAIDRVNGYVYFWWVSISHLFADIEHWCFVSFPFSDNNDSTHVNTVESLTHGINCGLIHHFFVPFAHPAPSTQRGSFGNTN